MKKTKEKVICEIDKFGQLPWELEIWLMDNAPSKIEVDFWYVKQMLKRLVDLRNLAKTHLAEIDIPITIEYILSVIPDKIKRKWLEPNLLSKKSKHE